MEQYANDRGPGQGIRRGWAKSPWSWNTSSFWMFNVSCKFACFLISEDTNITDICSLHDPGSFSLFKNNIFPDHKNSSTFSSFPWLVETACSTLSQTSIVGDPALSLATSPAVPPDVELLVTFDSCCFSSVMDRRNISAHSMTDQTLWSLISDALSLSVLPTNKY